MPNFDKAWNRQETQGMAGKIREAVKPQGALKPRIQTAVNKLQVQISKMDTMLNKLNERDAQLFQRVVTAMQQHDTGTSRVLSNELAEIRKVSKMLGNAKMSLEQVQMRLTTIHDLGDAMVAIGPAMNTMKGLKSSLGRFMPEADTELNSMTQTLDGLMVDSLAGESFNMESGASSEETERILQEASVVAEQQVGDRFPSVPSPTGLASQSANSAFE
ncbi:MAG: Snf7 family protein [Nitrosopumilus sp.]|nr:Snf7 family protein [Nitrosopumilus sp.]CAI9832546.1 putative SNF7 protein [Nitrosopumilaceae archaeon]MDA7941038.1 Snf7 family protein [Nitrosopumilus sp.]MDA7942564.1 Snf7 family protein [Nitrosopumilus sp.]MDA7944475.1 Snf7 family protein [Nitrosopumilus sp.]